MPSISENMASLAPIENKVVWCPIAEAFDNACNATIFTRIATRHSTAQLDAALVASPEIGETFCLTVNNVVLVFSATREEHVGHVRKVVDRLRARSMSAKPDDCVREASSRRDAGVHFCRVGNERVYVVSNEGVPKKQ